MDGARWNIQGGTNQDLVANSPAWVSASSQSSLWRWVLEMLTCQGCKSKYFSSRTVLATITMNGLITSSSTWPNFLKQLWAYEYCKTSWNHLKESSFNPYISHSQSTNFAFKRSIPIVIVKDWLFRWVFGFCMAWHIITFHWYKMWQSIECARFCNHKKPMNTIDFQNPGLAFNYCSQDLCVHWVCTRCALWITLPWPQNPVLRSEGCSPCEWPCCCCSGQKESLILALQFSMFMKNQEDVWRSRLSKLALEIVSKEQGILLPPEEVSFIGSSLENARMPLSN